MLKLAGAVLIILASVGLGYSRSRELTRRERNLEEFLQVILCLKGEIRCGNSSLPDALKDTAHRCPKTYETFLNAVASCMESSKEESLGTIFRKCAREHLEELALDKEEKRKIGLLGERLGYLDREMQIRQLELYEADFQYLLQGLKRDESEKKKLYRSLGIMGGIMLAILFW